MPPWFRRSKDVVSGPFSWEELVYLRDRGALDPDALVGGSADGPWKIASTVPTLFPADIGDCLEPVSPDASVLETVDHATRQSEPIPQAMDSPSTPRTEPLSPPPRPPIPLPRPNDSESKTVARKLLVGAGIGALAALLLVGLLLLFQRGTGVAVSQNDQPGGGATSSSAQDESVGSREGPGQGAFDGAGAGAPEGYDQPGDRTPTDSGGRPSSSDQPQTGSNDRPEETLPEVMIGLTPISPRGSGSGSAGPGNLGGGRGRGSYGDGSAFFGVRAKGRKFVYVVDCSGSMHGMQGLPFQKATTELLESIRNLRSRQSFYVIFFASSSFPMYYPDKPEPKLAVAHKKNIERCAKWIESFHQSGGTYPSDAMMQALKLKPDAIFLLTDGSFDASVVTDIRTHNKSGVVVNTIGFMNDGGEPLLKQIAEENRGVYRFVP